ncbi:hypothetical protein GCM10011365_15440 [Marinicella pacifica]|jgi:hypothetical protein|uniref:IPTL-CTERM protein sorting domain-containing protein n=1 Tax=Marinicella pacifica TaxID=1171543 RepID=A0A917CQL2_9GAMM|nr:hypothetical protein [Marinicella pacifica]GGF95021.1 hypothetical protein GCM10011365_15440 [Marinicella pacifica]
MKKALFLTLTLFALTAFAQTERQTNATVAQATPFNPLAPVPIADPGFEAGPFGGVWTESSTNFGTPICDVGGCGTGTGTGPNSGSFWTWFGGISAFEEASVSQSVTIPPAGSVTLSFFLESAVCNGTGFMEVLIDGNQEYLFDQTNPNCGVLGYNQVNVDLTAYQGQTVNLEFHSITQGDDTVNIFIDDVSMDASGTPPSAAALPVPSLQWYGMGLMLLILGFIGVRRLNH